MSKYHMTDCARVKTTYWQSMSGYERPHNGHHKLPHKDDEMTLTEWAYCTGVVLFFAGMIVWMILAATA